MPENDHNRPLIPARRSFTLPGIEDLSKEQDAVRALPREGRHLIVGGPGTGKSVLALLRARRHERNRDPYLFLVFNHLLHRASRQLYNGKLASETWVGWFHRLFFQVTGEAVPKLAPRGNDGFEPIDWNGAEDIIDAMPAIPEFERPCLVIDEGQDMPPQFYGCLVNLGFENFFVLADQNQQIAEENSSRKDISNALAIDSGDVIELTTNYRNALPVARLARAFYTGDPASPPPELPAPGAELPARAARAAATPVLYRYDETRLDDVARRLLLTADRDPQQLIGVLAPNNAVRQRFHAALHSVDVTLDNPRPPVRTFHAGNRPKIAFDEGGILVINAQACKGLEFDTVVLADIDEHYIRASDADNTKRLFYVMAARARERVLMLMRRDAPRARRIEAILPREPSLLKREDL